MENSRIVAVVAELVGQRCMKVDNPRGSILRLDIGPMGKRDTDVATAPSHGWRHLTILSPWRLANDRVVLCDWNDASERGGAISTSTSALVGSTILQAYTTAPGRDLVLRFTDALELFVFGDSDEDGDAWFILGTDGVEIGARQIRADR